jgi:methyl-accepting chemotaxis protein
MRKLYLQIYLTFVGILILFGALASTAWLLTHRSEEELRLFESIEVLLGDLLPGPQRPSEEMQAALERFGGHLPLHLSVRGSTGALLAAVGPPLPAPDPQRRESGWMEGRGAGPTVAVRLPGERWLVARHPHGGRGFGHNWLGVIILLGAAIAIGAYPVVRRITRRLERLQTRVDALGAGELSARVEVEGNDEVAELAQSFNRAADRIEHLVEAQRSMLAGASHELRSPLAQLGALVAGQ